MKKFRRRGGWSEIRVKRSSAAHVAFSTANEYKGYREAVR
jgi:hypothetical protein